MAAAPVPAVLDTRTAARRAGPAERRPAAPGPPATGDADRGDGRAPATAALGTLAAILRETYPSVADRVLALATDGARRDIDEWLAVARALAAAPSDGDGEAARRARERALVATMAQALEAQARSSARLAGHADSALDEPSPFAGDPPGARLWEHYLCPQARLAREALHGAAVGTWLAALGELWQAADAAHRERSAAVLVRLKVALTRVAELAYW